MVLAIVPAMMLFIGRVSVGGGSTGSTGSSSSNAPPTVDVGPSGIATTGTGTCLIEPTGVLIEGTGMTSCRTQEWGSNLRADPRVDAIVDGVDAGATAVLRFRETAGDRIEVAIGRTAVVIRQLDDGVWSMISSTERRPRDAWASNRVDISVMGRIVSVELDGQFVSAGMTTVLDPGSFSVGAVLSDAVAVRFASIELTDAG